MRPSNPSPKTSQRARKRGPVDGIGERRWGQRDDVNAVGVISYQGQRFSTSCMVVDASPGGARLELDLEDWVNPITSTRHLPRLFKLMVISLGFEADCAVAWRDKAAVGVRFVGKLRPTPPQFRKRRTFAPAR